MRLLVQKLLLAFLTISATSACAPAPTGEATGDKQLSAASFDHFTYRGQMPTGIPVPQAGEYQNPVLTGFYPDPSITKGQDAYYLVTSTFAYFPGIPVFRSTDLVSWEQVGNVIDRPGMLDFSGLGLSRGVFAPTIEYQAGVYYVLNTCVDCGGNFLVTATSPAGPWSDPIWLPEVGGIDPSIFFDTDGRVYIMNNDAPPEAARYDGHRAIWIREVDPETFQSISEPVVLLNGGVRPEENPIWIEGPHIYLVDGTYYLWAAEGGTAVNHSQVVLRADIVLGPYTPYDGNPILTQRHLPEDRPNPITSVGHADMVQDDAGQWWATFLGTRPYEGDYYNTGRETFLMPVRWENGWPVMMSGTEEVPYIATRPVLPISPPPAIPVSGNFEVVDGFDGPLGPHWMTTRVPSDGWYSVDGGKLHLTARAEKLGQSLQPSLWVRRQQHLIAEAETSVDFQPLVIGDEAGLAVLQSDDFYLKLGVGLDESGDRVLRLHRRAGADEPASGREIASTPLRDKGPVAFKVTANGPDYHFFYQAPGEVWQPIGDKIDGRMLSTRTAGGFVGATFGVYAETSR